MTAGFLVAEVPAAELLEVALEAAAPADDVVLDTKEETADEATELADETTDAALLVALLTTIEALLVALLTTDEAMLVALLTTDEASLSADEMTELAVPVAWLSALLATERAEETMELTSGTETLIWADAVAARARRRDLEKCILVEVRVLQRQRSASDGGFYQELLTDVFRRMRKH